MVKPVKYNSLKLKIGNWVLNRNLKRINRIIKVCSLSKAETVGITFVVNNQSDLEDIRKILKDLSSKHLKTYAIGYIPVKKPDDYYLSEKGFNFFSNADLDYRLIPKSDSVLEFIKTNFDVLIDFGTEEYFPMSYVINMSKAGLKVGRYGEKNPFDVMIDLNSESSKNYYYEQALIYLEKFK